MAEVAAGFAKKDFAKKDQEVAAESAAVAEKARVETRAPEPVEVSVEETRRQVQRVVLAWVVETVKAEAADHPG